MTRRRPVPALVAAVLALLALPAAAQATEPWPCFVPADPDLVVYGPLDDTPYDLDASCSSDPDGHAIVLYEWDFDGDGRFELSAGGSPLVTHSFTDRGRFVDAAFAFGLRVTDSAGESSSFDVPVRLRDDINSWFTFQPQIVNPGDEVTLRALVNPAAGSPATAFEHAWDLDADGAFEHATGSDPYATFAAPDRVGKHPVSLRVADDLGRESVIKREIEIAPRHPSRDQLPWLAPANLGDTPVIDLQAEELRRAATTVAPVGPEMPVVEPQPDQIRTFRPKLRRLAANRNGLTIEYGNGLKWKHYKVVVRLPAKRAVAYGLPRRTVVLARGSFRFNGQGVGKVTMRWTKGAYRIFRRIDNGVVDILATPVG